VPDLLERRTDEGSAGRGFRDGVLSRDRVAASNDEYVTAGADLRRDGFGISQVRGVASEPFRPTWVGSRLDNASDVVRRHVRWKGAKRHGAIGDEEVEPVR
jgi:hypothetical protein